MEEQKLELKKQCEETELETVMAQVFVLIDGF